MPYHKSISEMTVWPDRTWRDSRINLFSNIRDVKGWPQDDCIHFSESSAIAIKNLEKYLLSLKDAFAESVTLLDTNVEFKERYPSWQYPTKEPWLIRKSDLEPD